MATTKIFKSYEEFLKRADKTVNGVTEEHAKRYPDYAEDNETNESCWCCVGCIDCVDSVECFDCIDCIRGRYCYRSIRCVRCVDCKDCTNGKEHQLQLRILLHRIELRLRRRYRLHKKCDDLQRSGE